MKVLSETERLRRSIVMGVRFENRLMEENDELREEIDRLREELRQTKAELQYYIKLSIKEGA